MIEPARGEAPGIVYGLERLLRIAVPKISITAPTPGIVFERDVVIEVRDGTKLRANVFRPSGEGQFPVLMCAHPYGKDAFPASTPVGNLPPKRYRFMRQPDAPTFSAYTTWEAPDPSRWVPRGYAFVNLDLRGFGRSEGAGALLSDQEAADYAEVIEWAGRQPWSTGKVGLFGVSYLAISQWKVAALRPKALAAICPWEGFSDPYRDVAYPGGVRENGFFPFWADMTEKSGRTVASLRREQFAHTLFDDFWKSVAPDLERIEAPALICASFSDHGLHSRGSFEAFRRIASKDRFLYTHRGGKWSTFYGAEAMALQARFFDCYLKGEENGMRSAAPVRLEVRVSGDAVHEVREERGWPLARTRWTTLHLGHGTLAESPARGSATTSFDARTGRASFTLVIADDLELAGPMKLRLYVELSGCNDAHLFVAVRKIKDGRNIAFEGTGGFGYDVVTKGWARVALRHVDEDRSEPHRPVLSFDREEWLSAGQIVPIDVELLASATLFRQGETLRLDVQGHWFWRRSMFFGTFPNDYAPSGAGTVVLHTGNGHPAHLLVPRSN